MCSVCVLFVVVAVVLLHICYILRCIQFVGDVILIRVATSLENLEYSGISLNMENSGNFQEILCNIGEKL